MKIGRPDHPEDHLKGDDEASVVDVIDLDMVLGDHGQRSYHHVAAGKGEPNRVSRCRVVVEKGTEGLGSRDTARRGAISGEHRPASGVHADVGRLAWSFDRHVVLTRGDDGAAEGMATELDGDTITAVDQLFGAVRERQLSLSLELGQTLVLSGLLAPFPARALSQLRSEIGIGIGSVLHGFRALDTHSK